MAQEQQPNWSHHFGPALISVIALLLLTIFSYVINNGSTLQVEYNNFSKETSKDIASIKAMISEIKQQREDNRVKVDAMIKDLQNIKEQVDDCKKRMDKLNERSILPLR